MSIYVNIYIYTSDALWSPFASSCGYNLVSTALRLLQFRGYFVPHGHIDLASTQTGTSSYGALEWRQAIRHPREQGMSRRNRRGARTECGAGEDDRRTFTGQMNVGGTCRRRKMYTHKYNIYIYTYHPWPNNGRTPSLGSTIWVRMGSIDCNQD